LVFMNTFPATKFGMVLASIFERTDLRDSLSKSRDYSAKNDIKYLISVFHSLPFHTLVLEIIKLL